MTRWEFCSTPWLSVSAGVGSLLSPSWQPPKFTSHRPIIHVALATCRPPYPTPSSATRNWVRFARVICYEKLRFPGSLAILASRRFSRKLMMGNDLDRNCPDLASPARSWRNSITNKGFAVFLPIELMLSKGGSYWLRFATCRLRFRLRIATFPATFRLRVGYKAAGPGTFWHQGMRLAHVRSLDDGRASTASWQINPGWTWPRCGPSSFCQPFLRD